MTLPQNLTQIILNIWLKTYSINCFLATSSKRPIRNNGSKRISLLSSWAIQRKFHWSRISIVSSVGTCWIKLLSWHFRSRFSKRNIQTTTPACGNLSDSTQEVEQTFNIIKKRLRIWLLKFYRQTWYHVAAVQTHTARISFLKPSKFQRYLRIVIGIIGARNCSDLRKVFKDTQGTLKDRIHNVKSHWLCLN